MRISKEKKDNLKKNACIACGCEQVNIVTNWATFKKYFKKIRRLSITAFPTLSGIISFFILFLKKKIAVLEERYT